METITSIKIVENIPILILDNITSIYDTHTHCQRVCTWSYLFINVDLCQQTSSSLIKFNSHKPKFICVHTQHIYVQYAEVHTCIHKRARTYAKNDVLNVNLETSQNINSIGYMKQLSITLISSNNIYLRNRRVQSIYQYRRTFKCTIRMHSTEKTSVNLI